MGGSMNMPEADALNEFNPRGLDAGEMLYLKHKTSIEKQKYMKKLEEENAELAMFREASIRGVSSEDNEHHDNPQIKLPTKPYLSGKTTVSTGVPSLKRRKKGETAEKQQQEEKQEEKQVEKPEVADHQTKPATTAATPSATTEAIASGSPEKTGLGSLVGYSSDEDSQ
jgi:hypothetical protein